MLTIINSIVVSWIDEWLFYKYIVGMQKDTDQYREILKQELKNRIAKNPSLSMRSFCKKVGIDPGQLSRVLHGKQNLSLRMASHVAYQIFSSPHDRERFLTLVEIALARSPLIRDRLIEKSNRLAAKKTPSNLSLNSLHFISDWYYFAVLELIDIQGFINRPTWIAHSLGISPLQVKMALDALLSLGLIQKTGKTYQRTHARFSTPSNIAHIELRRINRQLIQKSVEALDEQPIQNRYVVGKTFAVSKKDLPKIQDMIERFRSELSDYLIETTEPKDSVYQCNIQLVELTTTFRKKESKT